MKRSSMIGSVSHQRFDTDLARYVLPRRASENKNLCGRTIWYGALEIFEIVPEKFSVGIVSEGSTIVIHDQRPTSCSSYRFCLC